MRKGEGMSFSDVQEVHRAYESRGVDLQAQGARCACGARRRRRRAVHEQTRVVATTVGRALLSEILPKGLSFDLINQDMTKKTISATSTRAIARWV